jgi:hypothetical protein
MIKFEGEEVKPNFFCGFCPHLHNPLYLVRQKKVGVEQIKKKFPRRARDEVGRRCVLSPMLSRVSVGFPIAGRATVSRVRGESIWSIRGWTVWSDDETAEAGSLGMNNSIPFFLVS